MFTEHKVGGCKNVKNNLNQLTTQGKRSLIFLYAQEGELMVSRHNSTICVIVAFIIVMTTFSLLFYGDVEKRAEGLRGSASLIEHSIIDRENPRATVEYWISRGKTDSHKFNTEILNKTTFQEVDAQKLYEMQQTLYGYIVQSSYFSDLAQKTVQGILDKENETQEAGFILTKTSFENLLSITTELTNITSRMETIFLELENATNLAESGTEQEMKALKTKGIELENYFIQADGLVKAADVTIAAIEPFFFAPFVLVMGLYIIFLMFPWVILVLFFLRKKETLIETKKELVRKLELSEKFREPEEESRQDWHVKFGSMFKRFKQRLLESKPPKPVPPTTNSKKTKRSPKRTTNGKDETISDKELRDKIEFEAFGLREYLLSLFLVTAINAALFYLFFYPSATTGLAHFITNGGGITAFTDYITKDATPITFGFLGAYFWIINNFLRRYFSADLNPNSFISASVHLITVFIISAVLQIGAAAISQLHYPVIIVAFVFGIFPRYGIQWILNHANRGGSGVNTPREIDKNPLTKLDGLNTWHEARLLEEKVENVQNLATVSLKELIINTNYSADQLVDWVDQALLFIHTQDLWHDSFQAVGIRTATDLLDNAGCNEKSSTGIAERIEKLTVAINAAQAVACSQSEQPRNEAFLAAANLYKSAAQVQSTTKEADKIAKTLDKDKKETLDVRVDLKKRLENTVQEFDKTNEQIKKLKKAADEIKLTEKKSEELKKAVTNIENSAKELKKKLDDCKTSVEKSDSNKLETLANTEMKQKMESCATEATNLQTQVTVVDKIIQESKEELKEEPKKTALQESVKETAKMVEAQLKAVKEIRDIYNTLDKDQPKTVNKVIALQLQLESVQKAAQDVSEKMEKAKESIENLQTPSNLLIEKDKRVNAGSETTKSFLKTANEAKDKAAPLDIDKTETLAGLSETKELIEKASKASEEVKTKGQAVSEIIQQIATPPKMTKEILETMVNTINKGPNIKSLQYFWATKSRRQKQNQAKA
jgi:hypothetical protein